MESKSRMVVPRGQREGNCRVTNQQVCCGCCYLVAKSCPTLLRPHGLQPTRLLSSWDFPGKKTGVGCHFFLQGIFLTHGSNQLLLYCRWILYQRSYWGSPNNSSFSQIRGINSSDLLCNIVPTVSLQADSLLSESPGKLSQ